MTKRMRLSLLSVGAIVALVLALGVSAVFAQTDSDDPIPDTEGETTTPVQPWGQRGFPGQRGMGQHGMPEGLTAMDEHLADALNIDLDTLQEAREAARVNGIEQALDEGLITEAQAELLLENAFAFGFHRGDCLGASEGAIDHEALLADALNISVEALQEAKQEAHEAALAEMVESGYLTENQALLMAAQDALKDAIDRQALLADVLGVSPSELEEARGDREAMAALIEDSGLTYAELAEAMQAAHSAAVDQALEDGIITSEQYEAIQEAGVMGPGLGGPGGFGGMRGHGRGGHGGFGGPGAFPGFGQQPFSAPMSTGASI